MASASGLPCSLVMISARSSWFAIIRSNHLRRIAARSLPVIAAQGACASRAASTARRVSSAEREGTAAIFSPVAGLVTAIVLPEAEPIHSPAT